MTSNIKNSEVVNTQFLTNIELLSSTCDNYLNNIQNSAISLQVRLENKELAYSSTKDEVSIPDNLFILTDKNAKYVLIKDGNKKNLVIN